MLSFDTAQDDFQSLPKDLPFLNAICWQANPSYLQRLEPLEILKCYERGWDYLGVLAEPSPAEWQFIRGLVNSYGSWLATDFEVAAHDPF